MRGDVGRSGTIDKDGIEDIELENAAHHVLNAAFLRACVKDIAIMSGIDARNVVNRFAAAADAD